VVLVRWNWWFCGTGIGYFCRRRYFTPITAPIAATKAIGPATPAPAKGIMQPAVAAEPEKTRRVAMVIEEMRM
jgi:hypothetical protein